MHQKLSYIKYEDMHIYIQNRGVRSSHNDVYCVDTFAITKLHFLVSITYTLQSLGNCICGESCIRLVDNNLNMF